MKPVTNRLVRYIRELNVEGVKKLIRTDSQWLNWRDENGKTALHFLGDIQVQNKPSKVAPILTLTKYLIRNGMDLNAIHRIPDDRTFFPATPLWHAYAKGRNDRMVRYLLSQGADPQNCMYAIVWNNDVKFAKQFRKFGALTDEHSMASTPFLAAVRWGRFGIAEWLLNQGADADAVDVEGDSALHYMVKKNYPNEWFHLLRKFRVSVAHVNKDGHTPAQVAMLLRRKRILQFLATW